ncbi:MAG: CCA-adding enzyme [Methanoregulaceae archaeon PtaU1.Bin059]|nr:MAG: CCA-adding enzyme [Methanoregulaceae archaeon PtaU1.Bin059]
MTRTPLEEEVLFAIRPAAEETRHIHEVAERILSRVERSGKATAMVVGSVARGTWIHGDRDLDIFLLFDPSLPREELELQGLSLAREVANAESGRFREKYAEHPYINASIDGLDVDLVPCYQVESAARIQSAVDRTPFHTRYIRERIQPFLDDVLLLKQFAKAGGIYGSDQMTEGFAGYLCELLILHYGGFRPLLEAASRWRPGVLIDPEGHRSRDFTEPLVMVDPVDPGRNVSASVSLTRMCEFIELARGYLDHPSREFFFPLHGPQLSIDEAADLLARRETFLYAITLQTPPYIEDIVVPQLRKSLDALQALLDRHGFLVNRADCEMHEDQSMLLFELLVEELPAVKRHAGPPVWNRVNAEKFTAKYLDADERGFFSGPFIDEGMYVVEIRRPYTRAIDLLRSEQVLQVALGKHVKQSMEHSTQVGRGIECYQEEFAQFISGFLQKTSPMMRIERSRRDRTGA